MTVKELKEIIKDLPDNMKVVTMDSEWGASDSDIKVRDGKLVIC